MKSVRPTLDFLVNDAAVVYSLPLLFDRLNHTINHPRSSVADITKIITEDAGLSSSILRLANNILTAFSSQCEGYLVKQIELEKLRALLRELGLVAL
jgi:c-di-GMP-related signal transduction protein